MASSPRRLNVFAIDLHPTPPEWPSARACVLIRWHDDTFEQTGEATFDPTALVRFIGDDQIEYPKANADASFEPGRSSPSFEYSAGIKGSRPLNIHKLVEQPPYRMFTVRW